MRPRSMKKTAALLSITLTASLCAVSWGAFAQHHPDSETKRSAYQGPPWVGFVADRDARDVLRVASVLKESPASRAGLKPGDVITSIQETPIKSVRDLKLLLREHESGDSLSLSYSRGEHAHTTTLILMPTPTQKELVTSQLMGEPAPDFSFSPITTKAKASPKTSKLSNSKGKVTILEFWATWCKPCEPFKKELSKIAKKHGDDVHIIAMSTESVETLQAAITEEAMPYLVASDASEKIHDAYFVRGIPLVIILDAEHRVRKVITGEDDAALVSKSLKGLLLTESTEREK